MGCHSRMTRGRRGRRSGPKDCSGNSVASGTTANHNESVKRVMGPTMKRLLSEHSWLQAMLFGLVVALLQQVLQRALAGPFFSPDSGAYLAMSADPWSRFGEFYAPGLPVLTWFLAKLGLSVSITLGILSGAMAGLLFLVFRQFLGPLPAFISALAVSGAPSWLAIQSSYWSETGFVICLLILIYMLFRLPKISRAGFWGWLFITSFVFLCLLNFRQAGLFFLPALAFAVAWALGRAQLARAAIAIIALSAIAGINRLYLNRFSEDSSARRYQCAVMTASMSFLDLCPAGLLPELCAFEERRLKFAVQEPEGCYQYDQQWSNSHSSYAQYFRSNRDMCTDWHKVLAGVAAKHKGAYLQRYLERMWRLQGPWDWGCSELGKASAEGGERARDILDVALRAERVLRNIFLLVVPVVLVLLFLLGLAESGAVKVFLVLGVLGHSAGHSIMQGWPNMRYISINHLLWWICFLLLMAELLRKKASQGAFAIRR